MIVGIVGKPNTGKSTLFKALTLAEVEIANYPFTTIEKNEGIAFVKADCVDKEFKLQCNPKYGFCLNNKRFIPIKLIDVAGLVSGSHLGKGHGNKFLDDLRQADVLIHIIDISGSTNENGELVTALSYDPNKDVNFLEYELDMWFFQILKKGWDKFARKIQQENQDIKKALAEQLSGLKIDEELINNAIKKLKLVHKPLEWSDNDLKDLASELRKNSKPMIIAANKIDIEGSELNFHKLKDKFKDCLIIPCSAESELALKEATKNNLVEYIPGEDKFIILDENKLNEKQKNGLRLIKEKILNKYNSTGVQEILNKAVLSLLDNIVVYPVENENKLTDSSNRILPDAHIMPNESTALDLAYSIHTDIGDKFIGAIDIRTKRKLGKEYKLKNNDVLKIIAR